MSERWEYRWMSATGVIVGTAIAIVIANHSVSQMLVTRYLPLVRRLQETVLTGSELFLAISLSTVVVFCCLIPLYKPRPRRILDMIFLTQKRVLVAMFILATIGYFNMSYRLPRATLATSMGLLLLLLPIWFAVIGNQPRKDKGRAIIVGDNPELIDRAADASEVPVLGYLSPPIHIDFENRSAQPTPMPDGGASEIPSSGLVSLGGLSRLKGILVDNDITTVVLAFSNTDRGEFFGVLETCYNHGVEAQVLREYADSVLLLEDTAKEVVTVDLEPWDWQDRLFKRSFDIMFAGTALFILMPLLILMSIAIKIDSPGPVLYSQERTTNLGGTFQLNKFRSMVTNAEANGAIRSSEDRGDIDPRVTRVGRLLRASHLDEAPQLWSVFIGEMSLVGPRPERPQFDSALQANGLQWKKRWFVKPGLTGLAQINNATGFQPEEKLKWDIEYIQRQSFWFDLKIVIRQLWMALRDTYEIIRSAERSK